jgi:hypothetical protein
MTQAHCTIRIEEMAEAKGFRQDGPASAGPLPLEEVAERAGRLDITLDRVLQQLHAIAFADIRRVVAWDDGKLNMKGCNELLDGDAAAIAEIVASAKDRSIYRVKLHDKTPALALLARILEKLSKQDEPIEDAGEEARDFLFEELDRLAAEIEDEEGENPDAQESDLEAAQ